MRCLFLLLLWSFAAVGRTDVALPAGRRVVDARHGRFLVLETDTWVGRSLMVQGEWCEHELRLLAALVRPGDLVIDVGANIGSVALPLLALGRNVAAFEAQVAAAASAAW